MEVSSIDHLVLTVRDVAETLEFYEKVLGMQPVKFEEGRVALKFGRQKLNLHSTGLEFEPKAANAAPGTVDLCFITPVEISRAMNHVESCGVEIIEGPVVRTGANARLLSFISATLVETLSRWRMRHKPLKNV